MWFFLIPVIVLFGATSAGIAVELSNQRPPPTAPAPGQSAAPRTEPLKVPSVWP
jgi:hypothetical protein